ncbi:MAG: hypothetical protein ABR499_04810 [Gemmatimonadaceae bacterium]
MTGAPDEELPVFIMGPGQEPERLMLVGRPATGRVRVREWSGADWSAPPIERELGCAELVDAVERAVRDGRRVNQSPQVVRRWLDHRRR